MLSILTKHGYSQTPKGEVKPRPFRPTSIRDARQYIAETFVKNKWDEGDQARYFKMKGIEAEKLEDLTPDQVRMVLASMEAKRMIVFAD